MNKYKIVFILFIIALILLMVLFCKKHYVKYDTYYKVPNVSSAFYPDAYVFFHSADKLRRFFNICDDTRDIGKNSQQIDFDFEKYSYVIVFGARIDNMYYSCKTTLFNDPSPSYAKARRFGDKCVFINYKEKPIDSGVFFYRVKKNPSLRGFNSL